MPASILHSLMRLLSPMSTVSEAARYAADEVEEEFGDETDVGNNLFIGNSSLCLRP